MTNTVISVENLTKQYDLGLISTGTLGRDLSRWWARVRKQPDPFRRVDNSNPFADRPGESILALDDVSFNVEQGQALGIIGRNGAGKSTLLKILSRVTAPTSGTVKVKGRIGSLLEVGTGFHPELTGRENVFLNGAILGMRKAEVQRKFDEIVDFSGVEKFIDTPVKRYSSGMYVRLAFAVAAHLDPEILIVDEVLAVGDAEFQKKCLGKMEDVTGEGRTVLFVSHNMESMIKLCRKTMLMSSGKLVDEGDTESIVNKYLLSYMTSENNANSVSGLRTLTITNRFIENESGNRTSSIERNKKFSVIMNYSTVEVVKTKGLNIELRIYENQRNTLITILSTKTENIKFNLETLPKSGKFRVSFSGLPLKAGSYRIYSKVKSGFNLLYKNEQELQFYITDPPDYETGFYLKPFPFHLISEAKWQIE